MADAIKIATKTKHHEELEKSRSNKDVANQFSNPGITIATWKKNKEKIFEPFQNSSLERQRLKTGTYEKLQEALLKWLTSMRGNNISINGSILLEKAHEFAKAFNYINFAESNGWLRGWKERWLTSCYSEAISTGLTTDYCIGFKRMQNSVPSNK